MARDYVKKLAQMRAYSKTPAGRAAHARSHAKRLIKLADGVVVNMKVNSKPLLAAVANWR